MLPWIPIRRLAAAALVAILSGPFALIADAQDDSAPRITSLTVATVSSTTAKVSWTTDVPTIGKVA